MTYVYNEFEGMFVAGLEALRVGDPMKEETEVGPIATVKQLTALEGQVGAMRAAGGQGADGRGADAWGGELL